MYLSIPLVPAPAHRRSLAAQQRARAKEALSQTKTMQAGVMTGKKALQVECCCVVVLQCCKVVGCTL